MGNTSPGPRREDRVRWGRIGALRVHALGRTNTGPANEARKARFERMVDPDHTLPADVRAERARMMERAHMTRISDLGVAARRAKARARSSGSGA